MIDIKALRIGNWIHRKGSSAYGIVNGKLLALLEEDEKERERFEYIPLSEELLIEAGFISKGISPAIYFQFLNTIIIGVVFRGSWGFYPCHIDESGLTPYGRKLEFLHQAQNVYYDLVGHEIVFPESAKIINQAVPK